MTGPKDGDFWIVEFRGEVTIAQPIAGGARWRFIGDMTGHAPDKTFRAIRKLDLGALVDACKLERPDVALICLGLSHLTGPGRSNDKHRERAEHLRNRIMLVDFREVILTVGNGL